MVVIDVRDDEKEETHPKSGRKEHQNNYPAFLPHETQERPVTRTIVRGEGDDENSEIDTPDGVDAGDASGGGGGKSLSGADGREATDTEKGRHAGLAGISKHVAQAYRHLRK